MDANIDQNAKKLKWVLALCIFCLSFIIYLNSISNNFVFEDRIVVERNELVKNPSKIAQIFSTPYHAGYRGADTGLYRPLTIFSFSLNYAVSGLSKYSFHFVNILLNSLISLLVFLLLLEIDGRVALALTASLLFASHPIHTEVVSNLAGRAELLYALFFIAALMLYIRGRILMGRMRTVFLFLSMFSFFLSLLSKESAIVFPVVVVLYDLLLSKRNAAGRSERRLSLLAYLGFVIIAILYLLIRFMVLKNFSGGGEALLIENPLTGVAFPERFLGATKVLGKYLWLLVFPLRLSADYSFNQIKMPRSIFDSSVIVPLALFAVSIYIFLRALKKSRILAFLIAFFYVTYSIVSNYFVTIGTIMGERLLYLPSLSYCILLGLIIVALRGEAPRSERGDAKHAASAAKNRMKTYQVIILCIITLLYSARTVSRNLDWKDDYSMYSSTERVSPESVKVLNNFGWVLQKMKRYDDATERFKKALSIHPDYINARQNLAQTYMELGDNAKAEIEMKVLLSKHEDFAPGYFTLAEALRRENKLPDALAAVRRSLALKPDFPEAQDLLGKLLLESGDYKGAEEALKVAIGNDPDSIIYHNDLGLLYSSLNRFSEAITEFRKAITIDPNNAAILSNFGIACRGLGKYEDAIGYFTKALQISPDNSSIRYNLGITRMDQRNYPLAIGEFKKIIAQEPQNYEVLAKMGSSFIALARYDEAIDFLTRAIRANPRFEEAYGLRAKAYFILKRYDESLSDYGRVLELNPGSVGALNNRGMIFALQRKYALAREEWEKALKLAPNQQEIRLNLESIKPHLK